MDDASLDNLPPEELEAAKKVVEALITGAIRNTDLEERIRDGLKRIEAAELVTAENHRMVKELTREVTVLREAMQGQAKTIAAQRVVLETTMLQLNGGSFNPMTEGHPGKILIDLGWKFVDEVHSRVQEHCKIASENTCYWFAPEDSEYKLPMVLANALAEAYTRLENSLTERLSRQTSFERLLKD